MTQRARVCLVSGTRPEVVKLAPLHRALSARPELFDVTWIATGQHGVLADQVFGDFGLWPDRVVSLDRPAESIWERIGQLVAALAPALEAARPDLVAVQGDTASTLAGALAAAARGCPVAHVEAGLRSFDFANPYPEESIRHLLGRVADIHFAPTERARRNLLDEGVAASRIHVTGNTVVDALREASARLPAWPAALAPVAAGRRLVLATTHRRESWGAGIKSIAEGLRRIVAAVEDVEIILPVHPNPAVRVPLEAALGAAPRIRLVAPLAYPDFLSVLRRATLVLTDSGGVQEEAATLGVPMLVMRHVTERVEAIEAGGARLVGTDAAGIEVEAVRLLRDEAARLDMARAGNPFGDGEAGERIARVLARRALEVHGRERDATGAPGRLTGS